MRVSTGPLTMPRQLVKGDIVEILDPVPPHRAGDGGRVLAVEGQVAQVRSRGKVMQRYNASEIRIVL